MPITSNLEIFTSLLREGFVVAVNAHAVASFPGLPTVQFLIACSKQKRKGKAWSILSHEQHFVYLGRHRGEGCLIEETSLRPHLVVSVPSAGFRMIAKRKAYHSCFKRRKCAKCILLIGDHSPPAPVYLGRQYGIKWTRPSPSIFAYCKRPKTGRWEGQETKLLM